MIELKESQIIQTENGTNYILKHVLPKQNGVIGISEEGYKFFINFKDFKVVVDAGGGTDELCRAD